MPVSAEPCLPVSCLEPLETSLFIHASRGREHRAEGTRHLWGGVEELGGVETRPRHSKSFHHWLSKEHQRSP